MKPWMFAALMIAMAGCSTLTQPPSEAKARQLEASRATAEREARVQADAKKLEGQGLTSQEARSLAEARQRTARP